MYQQQLPCPVCNTKIPFDVKQLLAGVHFVCPNCCASFGISVESKPIVEEAMRKLDELKQSSHSK
jgi:transcription initiation factor IIE alpha subunit